VLLARQGAVSEAGCCERGCQCAVSISEGSAVSKGGRVLLVREGAVSEGGCC